MNTFIYALVDPDTKEVRYVGKTNDLKNRMWEHHQLSRLKSQTHKNNWIKKLLSEGKRAELLILEECDESNWQERECFHMSQYDNLTNSVKGGAGEFRKSYTPEMTDEIRSKISAKVKQRHKEGAFDGSQVKISKALQGKIAHKPGPNPSRFVGVTFVKRNLKWYAHIRHNSLSIFLGVFEDEEQAALMYDEKAFELHGSQAKLNLPEKFGTRIEKSSKEKKTSQFIGVSMVGKGKWKATIFIDGTIKYLGRFETEELAYLKRKEVEDLYRSLGHRIGKDKVKKEAPIV